MLRIVDSILDGFDDKSERKANDLANKDTDLGRCCPHCIVSTIGASALEREIPGITATAIVLVESPRSVRRVEQSAGTRLSKARVKACYDRVRSRRYAGAVPA